MIDLLHAVSDEIKRYCIEKGALQDAACDPLPLHTNHGIGYFDYELVLKEHPESNGLQYVKPENIQHPEFRFTLSPVHGIMEDSPANFTSCIPSNYNTEPVSRN